MKSTHGLSRPKSQQEVQAELPLEDHLLQGPVGSQAGESERHLLEIKSPFAADSRKLTRCESQTMVLRHAELYKLAGEVHCALRMFAPHCPS